MGVGVRMSVRVESWAVRREGNDVFWRMAASLTHLRQKYQSIALKLDQSRSKILIDCGAMKYATQTLCCYRFDPIV